MKTPEYIAIEKLKERADNPRKVDEASLNRLAESIKKHPDYFEVRPVLVNNDFEIFAGTMRVRAARQLGWTEVPCVVMDIPEERQKEIMLRDNRSAGEWDWSILQGFDLSMLAFVGFDEGELKVNFGLSDLDGEDIDPDQFRLLEVQPPESPRLKDRAQIQFDKYEDYARFKKAVIEGKIGSGDLIKVLDEKEC